MQPTQSVAQLAAKSAPDPKPWWQSKAVLLGIVMTIIGVATYFADPLHTPVATVASISEAIAGAGAIVLRIWFTDVPVSSFNHEKATRYRIMKAAAKRAP